MVNQKRMFVLICLTVAIGIVNGLDDTYLPPDEPPSGGSDPFGILDDGGDWFWEGLNDWDRDIGLDKTDMAEQCLECAADEKCVYGKCIKLCKPPLVFDPVFKKCAAVNKGSCSAVPCLSKSGLKCDDTLKKCICSFPYVWDSSLKKCVYFKFFIRHLSMKAYYGEYANQLWVE